MIEKWVQQTGSTTGHALRPVRACGKTSQEVHPHRVRFSAQEPPVREAHNVYVIELDSSVLLESKFRKSNPDYVFGAPCVYVGMTGLDPDLRFDQHKAGIRANKYARIYGIRLMPEIYGKFNPMPRGDAQYMEVELGIQLRKAGYGVWQA